MKADFYHYHKLTEREKTAYLLLYEGVLKLQPEIDLGRGIVLDNVSRIYQAILYDHPNIFYLRNYRYAWVGNHLKIWPNYFQEQEVEHYRRNLCKVTNSFLRKANLSGKSTMYKIEKVHDMLIEKINYDTGAIDTLSEEHKQFAHSIMGVLFNKRAVCSGISKTYKLILNHVGVDCIVITGCDQKTKNSPYPTHAWNVVKNAGEKLHVDVTWDNSGSKAGMVSKKYFCLQEAEIRKSHFNFSL